MENKDKTKEELIDEIKLLQMRIIQLETRDVEEKKQQVRIDHEKLQDALQLLRKGREESLNSLDGLAYVSDMKTYETLFVNKYGKKIWGDFTGKPCWQNLQTGQNGPCSFCTNDRLLQSDGTPAEVYVWEFQNTVTERWYECRDSAILWPDERMVRLEIATDITERKKAEEAEKREQAINKAIIDSIPGAFYMLDENGRYVRSNAYQRDEILGKSEGFIRMIVR